MRQWVMEYSFPKAKWNPPTLSFRCAFSCCFFLNVNVCAAKLWRWSSSWMKEQAASPPPCSHYHQLRLSTPLFCHTDTPLHLTALSPSTVSLLSIFLPLPLLLHLCLAIHLALASFSPPAMHLSCCCLFLLFFYLLWLEKGDFMFPTNHRNDQTFCNLEDLFNIKLNKYSSFTVGVQRQKDKLRFGVCDMAHSTKNLPVLIITWC